MLVKWEALNDPEKLENVENKCVVEKCAEEELEDPRTRSWNRARVAWSGMVATQMLTCMILLR